MTETYQEALEAVLAERELVGRMFGRLSADLPAFHRMTKEVLGIEMDPSITAVTELVLKLIEGHQQAVCLYRCSE